MLPSACAWSRATTSKPLRAPRTREVVAGALERQSSSHTRSAFAPSLDDFELDLALSGLREIELLGSVARASMTAGLDAPIRSLTVTTTLYPFSTLVTFTLVLYGSFLWAAVRPFLS
jgi:hypothetical protein